MNWYRIYKIAEPIIEDLKFNRDDYMDIGHAYGSDSILWYIDTSYRFYSISEEELSDDIYDQSGEDEATPTHGDWLDSDTPDKNILCSGRYDINSGQASFLLGFHYRDESGRRKEYIRNKAVKILDRELNNPTITGFN